MGHSEVYFNDKCHTTAMWFCLLHSNKGVYNYVN